MPAIAVPVLTRRYSRSRGCRPPGTQAPAYSLTACPEAPMKAGVLQGVKVSQA